MASPQLLAMSEVIKSLGRMEPDHPVELQRLTADSLGALYPLPEGVTVTACAGGVTGDWVEAPDANPGRVVLYLHGGGYVIGGPSSHRLVAARVSAAAGAKVLLLDYRLAPEHPFPAALDDTSDALDWLLDAGYEPAATGVAGDSAGAGLALAAVLRRRHDGRPLPAAISCVSPWVDLRCTAASIETRDARDYVLSGPWVRAMAARYLDGTDPADPRVSPVLADLSGLPPLHVIVGSEEVLHDDALGLVERARRDGVDVAFEEFEDCAHWWTVVAPDTPEAQAGTDAVGAFLRRHLA